MKILPIAVTACLMLTTASAYALPARMIASLKKMDPATRFEQRCNIEAMDEIARHDHHMRPAELVTYAFGNPTVTGNLMVAKGAAFRSHGIWRHLTYRCKTNGDHMNVLSFSFKVGDEVPRKDWSKHYLVPR